MCFEVVADIDSISKEVRNSYVVGSGGRADSRSLYTRFSFQGCQTTWISPSRVDFKFEPTGVFSCCYNYHGTSGEEDPNPAQWRASAQLCGRPCQVPGALSQPRSSKPVLLGITLKTIVIIGRYVFGICSCLLLMLTRTHVQ